MVCQCSDAHVFNLSQRIDAVAMIKRQRKKRYPTMLYVRTMLGQLAHYFVGVAVRAL
jgi:hypothetical protein